MSNVEASVGADLLMNNRYLLVQKGASITVSAPLCSPSYPTARRGGLRGAGGSSTDSMIAVKRHT